MKTKIIHYCWFGGKPKPKIVRQCMESWKKYCPDWEIREWNESNFDVNCCSFVREAHAAGKWAFVSDYCRFYALVQCGGVYLDTDVELLRPIDDLPDTFVGFECAGRVASGLIRGAEKDDPICLEMLEGYRRSRFLREDGSYNMTVVGELETDLLMSQGLFPDDSLQTVNGTTVFPREYFSPIDFDRGETNITANTYSIHHYAASWISPWGKFKLKIRSMIGIKWYATLYRWKHSVKKGK